MFCNGIIEHKVSCLNDASSVAFLSFGRRCGRKKKTHMTIDNTVSLITIICVCIDIGFNYSKRLKKKPREIHLENISIFIEIIEKREGI